jgi:hypothetical protein
MANVNKQYSDQLLSCSVLSFSLIGERISQQAIAQLIGIRGNYNSSFNVLIREDAKV